ncbi:MAG TPA: hypothetical protein VEA39_05025 [Methylophilaceae bacterium]|nr:hypothetical protein [Methylophilaceae bacterium]
MKRSILILSLVWPLAACSPSDPAPKVAENQRKALDQAKQVEEVLQQSADQTHQQVDEQSE